MDKGVRERPSARAFEIITFTYILHGIVVVVVAAAAKDLRPYQNVVFFFVFLVCVNAIKNLYKKRGEKNEYFEKLARNSFIFIFGKQIKINQFLDGR